MLLFPIELVLRVPKEQTLVYDRIVHIKTSGNVKILFFSFIFISWRQITLQYCSGFCHTLT